MGLTDERQMAKNITDYRQNEKKHYRLPTEILTDNRQSTWSNIVRMFLLRKKIVFLILSKLCVKVDHFKPQFRYL